MSRFCLQTALDMNRVNVFAIHRCINEGYGLIQIFTEKIRISPTKLWRVWDTIINHLMYADDLVLISPSATGMKELLCAYEVYSLEHAILIYNSVLKCQHTILKSGASTPRTVTKFAVKTAIDLTSTI